MPYKQMDVEKPFYPCDADDILLRGGEVDRTFAHWLEQINCLLLLVFTLPHLAFSLSQTRLILRIIEHLSQIRRIFIILLDYRL